MNAINMTDVRALEARRKAHKKLVYVSWSDDGVTLMCKNSECMEIPAGQSREFYWQREIDAVKYPDDLYPEDLELVRDHHVQETTK